MGYEPLGARAGDRKGRPVPVVQGGEQDLMLVISSAALDPEKRSDDLANCPTSPTSGRTCMVHSQHQGTPVGLHRTGADRGDVGPPLRAARRYPAISDGQDADADDMRDLLQADGATRPRCSS